MARTIKNDKVEKQIVVAVVPQKSKENEKYRKIIGGMAGGVVEACCLHPLDTIKTRIQLSRGGSAKTATTKMSQPCKRPLGVAETTRAIIRDEGLVSLYKGLSPFMANLVSKYCLRFSLNYKLRELVSKGNGATTNFQNFCCGLITGITEALLIVTPFEVVKTRLQAQTGTIRGKKKANTLKYSGIIPTMLRIIQREGPGGLWKGCTPTVFRQATNQACMFASYTFLRKRLWSDPQNLSAPQAFVTGLTASMVGPLLNCPADVIKTRLMNQTDSMVEPEMRYKGFVDAYFRILREEGVTALYKGIFPRLARLAPGQGLTWIMVEKVNTICNENRWLQ